MKKTLALLMALLMIAAALVGCGGDNSTKNPGNSDAQGGQSGTVSADGKKYGGTYRASIAVSVTTLNTLVTSDTYPQKLKAYCATNLYRSFVNETKDGYVYLPMLASSEPIQVDEQGLVWRVPLRTDYKWQNGETMNADTVIYTWQTIIDPYLLNIQSKNFYNHTVVKIKNAAEYQQQTTLGLDVPWSDVGLRKIDDYTVELEVTRPISALDLMSFLAGSTFAMIHKDTFEKGVSADRTSALYGTSLDNWMSSGEYFLTEWIQDSKYTFTKNPDYVYADQIYMDTVEFRVISDSNTALELFLRGDLDTANIVYSQWEDYEDDPRVYEYWDDSTMYLFVNTANPNYGGMLGNINFRKAVFYGIDRVECATSLGCYPYSRIYRRAVVGDANRGIAFIDMPGADYVEDPYDIFRPAVAAEYLDKAFEECQQTNVSFEIYYKEDGTHTRAATEIMQDQISKNLEGVNMTVRAVPQAQAYSLRRWDPSNPTAYDMNVGSILPGTEPIDTVKFYSGDYKPNTFYWPDQDLLDQYDTLYRQAERIVNDNDLLISLCQQMEKLILVDECLQIPIYERPERTLFAEHIQLPVDHYINGWGFGEHYICER